MKEGGPEGARLKDNGADDGRQVGIPVEEGDEIEDLISGLEPDPGKHHKTGAREELATCEGEAPQRLWTAGRMVDDPFNDLPRQT